MCIEILVTHLFEKCCFTLTDNKTNAVMNTTEIKEKQERVKRKTKEEFYQILSNL